MRQDRKKSRLRLTLFVTVAVFTVSYVLFLVAWVGVKDGYGRAVTGAASAVTASVFDVTNEKTVKGRDSYTAYFRPERHNAPATIKADVSTSTYTFNAPLTLAIMAAFFPFLKRRESGPVIARLYAEAAALLFCVHLLYVFSFQGMMVSKGMMRLGYADITLNEQFFWQYLWGFVDNMVIRFEPFLIGAYLYFRRGS